MLAISFLFPGKKYHATTWGKHVNEADVEWPPSQWRILRSIMATWLKMRIYTEDEVGGIVSEMMELPVYRLPVATMTHKRHYMPQNKAKKTLIFDAFLAFEENAELQVCFPHANLNERQIEILDDLLKSMNYLGRSESWVSARILKDVEVQPTAYPLTGDPEENKDTVKLLCFDDGCLSADKLFEKDNKGNYIHPLFSSSAKLRKKGFTYPPMTRFVNYVVPEDRFETGFRNHVPLSNNETVHYAKYLIDSPVLPSKKETVDIADKIRSSLMKIHQVPSKVFSGKDENGKPLEGNEHAFYLPYDEDGDGKLDRVIVYSSMGFDNLHQEALFKLRKLYGYPLKRELNLILLDFGEIDDVQDNRISEVIGRSKVWKSITPFLLTRHPKKTRKGEWKEEHIHDIEIRLPSNLGYYPNKDHLLLDYGVLPDNTSIILKDGAVSQLLRSIKHLGIEKPIVIKLLPGTKNSRWLEFKRYRRGKNNPAISIPYGFELEFAEDITGPMAIGYGAHQGLGMFIAGN
jgi:CRISPR-associated protein Csb2